MTEELNSPPVREALPPEPAAPEPAQAAAGNPAPAQIEMTPGQAKAELALLKGDRSFTADYLAGDATARARMDRLHQLAHPAEPGAEDPLRPPAQFDDSTPSTPEGYGSFPLPSNPEATGPEMVSVHKEITEAAHGMGASRAELHSFMKRLTDVTNNAKQSGGLISDTQRAAAHHAAETVLRKEYGDAYERKIASAQALLDKRAPALGDLLETTGLSNDTWIIRTLINLAEKRAGK